MVRLQALVLRCRITQVVVAFFASYDETKRAQLVSHSLSNTFTLFLSFISTNEKSIDRFLDFGSGSGMIFRYLQVCCCGEVQQISLLCGHVHRICTSRIVSWYRLLFAACFDSCYCLTSTSSYPECLCTTVWVSNVFICRMYLYINTNCFPSITVSSCLW